MNLKVSDYVIDSDYDICRVDKITNHIIEMSYIEKHSNRIFRATFSADCDWVQEIVRGATPSEMVLAKFKGLV